MIFRLACAALGGVVVTIGLLLFMDDVTNRYLMDDPMKYFRITDYIPAPDRGRQLPDVPVIPGSAPDRPLFEYSDDELPPADELPPWILPEEQTPGVEEQMILDERQAHACMEPDLFPTRQCSETAARTPCSISCSSFGVLSA